MNTYMIEQLKLILDQSSIPEPNKEQLVSDICDKIETLFNDAAVKTFGSKGENRTITRESPLTRTNKPIKQFFDKDCKHSRYLFIKARKKI